MAPKKKPATRCTTRRGKKAAVALQEDEESQNANKTSDSITQDTPMHENGEDNGDVRETQAGDNGPDGTGHMASDPVDAGVGRGDFNDQERDGQGGGEEQGAPTNTQTNAGGIGVEFDGGDIWTAAKEDHLIVLYRAARHLWDKAAPGYKTKNKRDIAIREWSQAMSIEGM